jgi:hypothetical protein
MMRPPDPEMRRGAAANDTPELENGPLKSQDKEYRTGAENQDIKIKRKGGRGPKAKGARCELEVARQLQSHGLVATKTPLSGSLGGIYSGDVRLTLLGRELVIECKSRKKFDTLHGWLQNRDLLVLRANHQVGLVVLPLDLFAEIAAKAEGSR